MKIQVKYSDSTATHEFERDLDKRALLEKLDRMISEAPDELHIYYSEAQVPVTVAEKTPVTSESQKTRKHRGNQRWTREENLKLEKWYFNTDNFVKNDSRTCLKSSLKTIARELGRSVDSVKVRVIGNNANAGYASTCLRPLPEWQERKWQQYHDAPSKEEARRKLAEYSQKLHEQKVKQGGNVLQEAIDKKSELFSKIAGTKKQAALDVMTAMTRQKTSLMNKRDAAYALEMEAENDWIAFVENVLKHQVQICDVLGVKGAFKVKDKQLIWTRRAW